MDKNDVTSRIPRVDRILGAPAHGATSSTSRIPHPNAAKSTSAKPSLLAKPGDSLKPSKLVRLPSLRSTTGGSSSSSSAAPSKASVQRSQSIPKSHSNGAIAGSKIGTFVRPPVRMAVAKDAIVPDLDQLMPHQPAIEDEVLSLVGSTDCLLSGGSSPVIVDQQLVQGKPFDQTKVLEKTTTAAEKRSKAPSRAPLNGKVSSKPVAKSKVGEKKVLKKKAAPTELKAPTPSRTRTFIASNNATVTKSANLETPLAVNGTVVLKRDNTFDISDMKAKGVAAGQYQETPVYRREVPGKMRPKCLQLEAMPQDFQSPSRFSLDLIPASTPLEANGRPENVIENTFMLERTPQVASRTVDLGHADPLIQFDATVDVPPASTGNFPVNVDATLFRGVKSRDSWGLLSESQIAKLEESFDVHMVTASTSTALMRVDSNLIKLDESQSNDKNDKTLVPEQSVSVDDKPSSTAVAPVSNPVFGSHSNLAKVAQRLSFAKLPDASLSCSIDLEDVTNPIRTVATPTQTDSNSFEMDESLGILTPDQMKDFGDTTASRPSLDLCLIGVNAGINLRVEQTPSPEELPLDPPLQALTGLAFGQEKNEGCEMTESAVMKSSSHSKGSHLESSVITSVTSITSLDGYQGDGEMSRPASRNAEYVKGGAAVSVASPSKQAKDAARVELPPAAEEAVLGPIVRRPDAMTDSDFFTESDAEDQLHRGGDRRAQIIDGHLYGRQNVIVMEGANNAGGNEGETSGMESSGVFTDNEPMREELQFDMSPDDRSTETVQSQRRAAEEEEEDLDGTIRFEDHQQAMEVEEEKAEKEENLVTVDGLNDDAADQMEVDSDVRAEQTKGSNKVGATKRTNPSGGRSSSNSNSPPTVKKKMVEQPSTVCPATPSSKGAKQQQQQQLHGGHQVKKTPNKWDAVMNKIAQNQSVTPTKNYNEVKSRVNSAPKNRYSAQSADGEEGARGGSRNSPSSGQRRQESCVTNPSKRGRFTTPSKDSRQSSQSDLSVKGTGQKASTMLVIPKKPQTIIQKQRTLETTPVKANGKRIRNGESPVSIAKLPLKENNRLSSNQQQQHQHQPASPLVISGTPQSPKTTRLRNASAAAAAVANNNNNNNHVSVANRMRSKESSPELTQEKRILEAVALLGQHKYAVLDDAAQRVEGAKVAALEAQLRTSSRGVEALGVLVNYLVHDYEAFSTPSLKHNYEVTCQKLLTTQQYLDETCKSFRDLEQRLADQDRRFQEQAEHLTNVDHENSALREQLRLAQDDLDSARRSALSAADAHNQQREELETRLSDLVATENELRERAMESEVNYSARIRAGEQREKELQQRLQAMQAEFEAMRIRAETREQELVAQLEAHKREQEEAVVLRSQSLTEEATTTSCQLGVGGAAVSYRHSSPMKLSTSDMEAESLRSVLELKMTEVAELRRQNQDLKRTVDELGLQQMRTSSLESKVEDLQFQLNGRIERESDLLAEIKSLTEKVAKESKQRTRLSIHNEELQYKLKQNSERYQKTLQEWSKSYQEGSGSLEDACSSEEATVSPPASPKIKGIVETSDAVSWILEMDDESPGQVASRAIRRIGSFRGSPTNALKRSKSSSQSPMPLSQSASATSIARQLSAETSPMRGTQQGAQEASMRMRSKSMSVKSNVDRSRQRIGAKNGGGGDLMDTSFHRGPIHASSPYKQENGAKEEEAVVVISSEKRRAAIKNLSFSSRGQRERETMTTRLQKAEVDVAPLESAGEAMVLQISDGEDVLSRHSSLTSSTTSNSSSSVEEEETTGEKERTAISVHQVEEEAVDGGVFASLKKKKEEEREKWSPIRLVMGDPMVVEEEDEEEEDDVFNSESVV